MKILVQRYNPVTSETRIDEFEVPVCKDKNMTVMDVLDYISLKLDSTLNYYKHSVCNHGICGRCSLSVNGKVRLACLEVVNNYESLFLKPIPNRVLINDLVTK